MSAEQSAFIDYNYDAHPNGLASSCSQRRSDTERARNIQRGRSFTPEYIGRVIDARKKFDFSYAEAKAEYHDYLSSAGYVTQARERIAAAHPDRYALWQDVPKDAHAYRLAAWLEREECRRQEDAGQKRCRPCAGMGHVTVGHYVGFVSGEGRRVLDKTAPCNCCNGRGVHALHVPDSALAVLEVAVMQTRMFGWFVLRDPQGEEPGWRSEWRVPQSDDLSLMMADMDDPADLDACTDDDLDHLLETIDADDFTSEEGRVAFHDFERMGARMSY